MKYPSKSPYLWFPYVLPARVYARLVKCFGSVPIGAGDDPNITGSLSQLVLELSAVAVGGEVGFAPQDKLYRNYIEVHSRYLKDLRIQTVLPYRRSRHIHQVHMSVAQGNELV